MIVVDASSTDGSAEMVEKGFPFVRLVRAGKMGIGEALNMGIEVCKGRYVVFDLNSDDVVAPGWLSSLIQVINSSQDIGIVCGKRYVYGSDKILDSAGGRIILGITQAIGHNKKDCEAFSNPMFVDYVGVPMTRREIIKQVGMCDPGYYIYGEDVDFCLRVKNAGYKIVYVPDAIFWHRVSATIGKDTPRKIYYLSRSWIRNILKNYNLVSMLPLFILHISLFPMGMLISHSIKNKCCVYDYFKALTDSILWNLRNLTSTFSARYNSSVKK